MHAKPREEHDVGDDDSYYGSYCRVRVSNLVEESGANALNDFGSLFLLKVKLRQDDREISLTSLELGVMPCLEDNSIIVALRFHGVLCTCVDARVEDLGLRTQTLGWTCRFRC